MAGAQPRGSIPQRGRRFLANALTFHKDSLQDRYLDMSLRKDARGWPLDPPATLEWSRKVEALCAAGIALSAAGGHEEAAAGLELLLELIHRSNEGEIVYADEWDAQVYINSDWKRVLAAFFKSLAASTTPEEFERRGGAIAASWTWEKEGAREILARARRTPSKRKRGDGRK